MDLRERLREMVEALPEEQLPEAIGAFAEATTLAQLRLRRNGPAPEPADPERPERLLDVDEAAEMLNVDTRWLYRRADTLPFTRKLSARTLRFSERGILRWLDTRG